MIHPAKIVHGRSFDMIHPRRVGGPAVTPDL
jgi:hypothetical protein